MPWLVRSWIWFSSVALLTVVLAGCGPSGGESQRAAQPARGGHADHDHDHDGHDHDHDGHDHDHDGHDHDGHDHDGTAGDHAQPADFASGVASLHQQYEAIRDALQAHDTDKAHGPMHGVGELLEALPELAVKSQLGEQEMASVKSATDAMLKIYGQIDDEVHSGKQVDYTGYSEQLEKSMAELQAVLNGLAEPAKQ